MEHPLHSARQRQGVDRSPAFSGGVFGQKREEVNDMDSPMINVGKKSGCRR